MDGIEPLGIDGEEQAFRVTFRGQPSIVFHNATKQLSRCTECKFNKGSCEHVQMLEMHLEIQEHDCDWMNYINVALERYNTTNVRKLWLFITDGLMAKRNNRYLDYKNACMKKNSLIMKHGDLRAQWIRDKHPEIEETIKDMRKKKGVWEQAIINAINFKLERMTIYECGYLYLTAPAKIIEWEEFFHPNWYNGKEWLFDSNAFYVYLQTGQYITNDEENELLRQSMMPKGISTT